MKYVQDKMGDAEREFKVRVSLEFMRRQLQVRAYLVDTDNGIPKAVIAGTGNNEDLLVEVVSSIFRSMFSPATQLDIVITGLRNEIELRRTCSPFFSRGPSTLPFDFRLYSTESLSFEHPRFCRVLKRFEGGHPDGYLAVEIEPPVTIENRTLDHVILATRHSGDTLHGVRQYPVDVHIAKIEMTEIDFLGQATLKDSQAHSIAWGHIIAIDQK